MTTKPTTYRCLNKCGDTRYPQPKWTTHAGIDARMAKCPKSPKAAAQKLEATQAAEAKAKYAIGDTIHFVGYEVVSPAHTMMGKHKVRVRYYAATDKVRSALVLSRGALAYNNSIVSSNVFPTAEDAQKAAADRQHGHDEALKFARECR